jgi:sulfoxide reductase heme-binding subunit YedZ
LDSMTQWYVMRGTGTVLVALLTLSTVMGVISTARAGSAAWPRFATQALHRNVSLLTMAMLGVHVGIAVVDEAVKIRWFEAFIPLLGAYKGLYLWLGALATDLMIAVVVTSLLRHRLPYRSWRVVHVTGYAAWAFALWHGIGIGTDTTTSWGMGVTVASVGVVAAAAVIRIATLSHERRIAA